MEPNTGFVYKMLANPRSDGPDTRFFLQAYTRTENGALSPGDALYIGTAEKCRELLDRLISGELTQEQVRNSYIHGKEPTVRYYRINEEAARRAKDMNSFSEYRSGSATAGYRAMVDEAVEIAEKQKARVDPMYHDKIDYLVDLYARKLAENLNQANAIDARVPSILIAGGSYFRWSPSQGAWQRQLNRNAIYAADRIDFLRPEGGGSISALQPYHQKQRETPDVGGSR